MTINDLATMVHENAVEHGWWDSPRDITETLALIHSEWSEALEEARAGRPMAYKLDAGGEALRYVTDEDPDYDAIDGKPEGIAVELIDGVIRILDLYGQMKVQVKDKDGNDSVFGDLYSNEPSEKLKAMPFPDIVTQLHLWTSMVMINNDPITGPDLYALLNAITIAVKWVAMKGYDPLAILLDKHEYNKTRPYKHGKKF